VRRLGRNIDIKLPGIVHTLKRPGIECHFMGYLVSRRPMTLLLGKTRDQVPSGAGIRVCGHYDVIDPDINNREPAPPSDSGMADRTWNFRRESMREPNLGRKAVDAKFLVMATATVWWPRSAVWRKILRDGATDAIALCSGATANRRGHEGVSKKLVRMILLVVASGLALASCQDVRDAPDDCAHRTFGCDMTGRPL
jgi:hypothetical protein